MEESPATGDSNGRDICRLPELCISHAIAFTSPRDACRSAAVSTAFRSAVASDTVWERFLPPDYESILARAVQYVEYSSKYDLFFHLSDRPILIDGGNMSFALEKSSGAKCYMLSARQLKIIWGDTPQYWRWIQRADSRFSEVAQLLDVCWLEISGKIESKVLSQNTTYAAFLVFKLDDESYGLTEPPQEAIVRVGSHLSEHVVCLQPDEMSIGRVWRRPFFLWRQVLDAFGAAEQAMDEVFGPRAPQVRNDGWMEMELGDFYNDDGEVGEVEISLSEVRGGQWKRGLLIEGIEIRPKMSA